jgi:hypothetical protein
MLRFDLGTSLGVGMSGSSGTSGNGLGCDVVLWRNSSVGAYDEPRMKGVPLTLKRGVPSFQEGISTANIKA